jgi:hypothetical protein
MVLHPMTMMDILFYMIGIMEMVTNSIVLMVGVLINIVMGELLI